MANLNGFNAATVDPSVEFEAIPAGKYTVVIANSEMKPTKAGNGVYLELTFQVLEGEYKDRQLWARLNLDNPNQIAVKIAQAELSSICRAVGVLEPKDSCDLHNLPLMVSVKQKPDANGDLRNEIKGYAKRETGIPAKPAQTANPTAPWGR
jgi:hypothetical protein